MSLPAPKYVVLIKDAAGNFIEIDDYTSLSFSYSLNRKGVAELKIPVNSEKVNKLTTASLFSWLYIYRWSNAEQQSTEHLVWYGLLFSPSYKLDELKGDISLKYQDLAGILEHRRVSRTYSVATPTDASAILWDVITESQNTTVSGTNVGDLGIIQGSAPASKDREPKKDLQNRTILDILESFSDYIDGLDWEITPTPRNKNIGIFNTYFAGTGEAYHKGSVIDTKLEYIVDETKEVGANNIASLSIDEAGYNYANNFLQLGAAIEEEQLYSDASNDAQKLAIGLFEDVQADTALSEQASIDDRASEELLARSVIPYNIEASLLPNSEPAFGTFDVGDIFNVRVKVYNFRDFESQYRLYRLTVSVDSVGVEKMELELNNI